ncbi:hypothetical protein Pla123a_07970 [Posidoniimonas polymericola]|uniref:DUF5673 domain-containing protein n=1 Tax=Posidoniimonas polymericola TaxID=2528002 RepID=A0A5C5ZEX2_9BACT|nr:hypothetical protein [Posidoniimonas polymericola]TWT85989.1 hypothetical protein Pla123a_07970 [Posidoniimonas polymericola]
MASDVLPDELIDPPPRFGMRGLIALTTVVAVAMAWMAPTLRAWDAERWWLFGSAFGVHGMAAGGGWLIQERIMRRARRQAGSRLIWLTRAETDDRMASRSTTLATAPRPVGFSFAALSVVFFSFLVSDQVLRPSQSGGDASPYYAYVLYGVMMGVGCWYAYRPRSLRGVALGDGGVFLAADMKSHLWANISAPGWPMAEGSDTLSLRIAGSFPRWVEVTVPDDLQTAVAELLAEKLPPRQL